VPFPSVFGSVSFLTHIFFFFLFNDVDVALVLRGALPFLSSHLYMVRN